MIEANAFRLVTIYLLHGDEGLVCQFRDAIVARNICELFVLIERFRRLHTVIKHAFLCAGNLILSGILSTTAIRITSKRERGLTIKR